MTREGVATLAKKLAATKGIAALNQVYADHGLRKPSDVTEALLPKLATAFKAALAEGA